EAAVDGLSGLGDGADELLHVAELAEAAAHGAELEEEALGARLLGELPEPVAELGEGRARHEAGRRRLGVGAPELELDGRLLEIGAERIDRRRAAARG